MARSASIVLLKEDMRRSLEVALAVSMTMLATAFATGCGDASAPVYTNTSPVMTGGDNGGGGSQASTPSGSSSSNGSASDPSAPASSNDTPSTPPPAPPTGNIYFRVANFLSMNADACVSPDGGKTWVGPIMNQLASTTLAPSTVSARLKVPNAHFMVRTVGGPSCAAAIGNDMKVDDILGEWPATIVLASKAGAPMMKVLVDEPSLSDSSAFVRLVHAADWTMDADLGTDDGSGFTDVFQDAPFLGIAKQGAVSPQGYAALDPTQNVNVTLRTTKTQEDRASVTLSYDVDQKFTIFSMGDDTMSALLVCDDAATPGADFLTPCQ
jgi:hypothetical protein